MSHEIRTPMNAIIGMTSIGKSATTKERKDYCLTKIEDASEHLLGFINDILDVSKIEANKFDLSPVPFSFEKMLRRVNSVVSFQANEKRQKLSMHMDEAIPEVLIGDDQRLAQVITNLLGNSVKFTPEGGTIRLDAYYVSEDNGFCTLMIGISDTGIGISKEQQKQLFNTFHQAESSTTRKFGGTGLGLAISKSIVEMMGGRIWIESELGQGAIFRFTFQMERGGDSKADLRIPGANLDNVHFVTIEEDLEEAYGEATGAKADEGAPVPDENLGLFAGNRALLAEDMEINREIIIALLEPTQIKIDCAENGAEALRLFSESPEKYDLIFMDIQMPVMDGYEATKRIRALNMPNAKAVPIIALTANVFREDVDKSIAAGMNDHVGKPINMEEIMTKMRTYLMRGEK